MLNEETSILIRRWIENRDLRAQLEPILLDCVGQSKTDLETALMRAISVPAVESKLSTIASNWESVSRQLSFLPANLALLHIAKFLIFNPAFSGAVDELVNEVKMWVYSESKQVVLKSVVKNPSKTHPFDIELFVDNPPDLDGQAWWMIASELGRGIIDPSILVANLCSPIGRIRQPEADKLFISVLIAQIVCTSARCLDETPRDQSKICKMLSKADGFLIRFLKQNINLFEVINWSLLQRLAYDFCLQNAHFPVDLVTCESEGSFVRISAKFFYGLGFDNQGHDIVLYKRPSFETEWKFLDDMVNKAGRVGSIMGPPGVGKSVTALAYAASLCRNTWIITWINVAKQGRYVRFQGGKKYTGFVKKDYLSAALSRPGKHFMFLDGYVQSPKHDSFLFLCEEWALSDTVNNRLVTISSMSAIRGNTSARNAQLNLASYRSNSWTFEDYANALVDDIFFEQVQPKLDAGLVMNNQQDYEATEEVSDVDASMSTTVDESFEGLGDTTDTRRDLLASKFYFAGGSARYMFELTTNQVIDDITQAVSEVPNVQALLFNQVGERSTNAVNRLFALFLSGNYYRKSIVSAFAATELAAVVGPDEISLFRNIWQNDLNPSVDGSLFELWFFVTLRSTGLVVYDNSGNQYRWKRSQVVTIDPQNIPDISSELCWWKPKAWNQGGYDALYMEGGHVYFFQISKSKKHKLKLRFFAEILSRIQSKNYTINQVHIVFIIPIDLKDTFHISEVTYRGRLVQYGWNKGSEELRTGIVYLEPFSKTNRFRIAEIMQDSCGTDYGAG